MTARGLLRLMLRRWYLVLLGAVLSVAALGVATHQRGVYWTQFNVVLLPPAYEYYPNKIENAPFDLAPMAGLIVADWNGGHRPLITASGETPAYGEGLRQGAEVRLPNRGSQWQRVYGSPVIDVQVVGDNPETVAEEARRVARQLDGHLQRRQQEVGASRAMRMTTMMSPAEPTIYHISGSRVRASAATGVAGAVSTIVVVYWIDRWLLRRRAAAQRNEPARNGSDARSGTGADREDLILQSVDR